MIQLTPEQQQFVESQVAAGLYQAPEEVVQEALEQLVHRKSREQEAVNSAIQAGIADMEAGRGIPLNEMDAELRSKFGFADRDV